MSKETQPSLLVIGSNCLSNIPNFLNKEDLLNLRLVCKVLDKVINDYGIGASLVSAFQEDPLRDEVKVHSFTIEYCAIADLFYFCNRHKTEFSYIQDTDGDGLDKITTKNFTLKHFGIESLDVLSTLNWKRFFGIFPNLITISIDEVKVDTRLEADSLMTITHMVNICILELRCESELFVTWIKSMKNIQELELGIVFEHAHELFECIGNTKLKKLILMLRPSYLMKDVAIGATIESNSSLEILAIDARDNGQHDYLDLHLEKKLERLSITGGNIGIISKVEQNIIFVNNPDIDESFIMLKCSNILRLELKGVPILRKETEINGTIKTMIFDSNEYPGRYLYNEEYKKIISDDEALTVERLALFSTNISVILPITPIFLKTSKRMGVCSKKLKRTIENSRVIQILDTIGISKYKMYCEDGTECFKPQGKVEVDERVRKPKKRQRQMTDYLKN